MMEFYDSMKALQCIMLCSLRMTVRLVCVFGILLCASVHVCLPLCMYVLVCMFICFVYLFVCVFVCGCVPICTCACVHVGVSKYSVCACTEVCHLETATATRYRDCT